MVIQDGLGRLRARANFARLKAQVADSYIAFSDQDDIWWPAKLVRALARLRALEAEQAPGTPAMVHADRRLINAAGAAIPAPCRICSPSQSDVPYYVRLRL